MVHCGCHDMDWFAAMPMVRRNPIDGKVQGICAVQCKHQMRGRCIDKFTQHGSADLKHRCRVHGLSICAPTGTCATFLKILDCCFKDCVWFWKGSCRVVEIGLHLAVTQPVVQMVNRALPQRFGLSRNHGSC